jgi:cytidine deaminase
LLSTEAVRALTLLAAKARENAYAPYSGYRVGAAVVAEDERVFAGCNVENASWGLSLCAERAAIAGAVACGVKRLVALVVVTEADPPGTPCGACRQWMAELGGDDLEIIAANLRGQTRRFTLKQLLPEAFRLDTDGPSACNDSR